MLLSAATWLVLTMRLSQRRREASYRKDGLEAVSRSCTALQSCKRKTPVVYALYAQVARTPVLL